MARRSLSLAAYRALSRRTTAPRFTPGAARPAGELIWLHCPQISEIGASISLAGRLLEQRPGSFVLLTCHDRAPGNSDPARLPEGVILEPAPDDHPTTVAAFLAHWKPDLGIWLQGWLQPNLIDNAGRSGFPLMLIGAETAGFDQRRDRWLPELSGHLLRQFRVVTAASNDARRKLLRLGLQLDKVHVSGPLQPVGRVLPCEPTDLDEFSTTTIGRPIWLAAPVPQEEIPLVLSAHRYALRRAHRLLFVLVPATPEAAEYARQQLGTEFRCAQWDEMEMPAETHNMLLAEDVRELGLWYRLASVSLMGGTLTMGHTSRDPLEAATLGSAILYGPNVGRHLAAYSRLSTAGASRIVNDATSLSAAVSSLIAPDQAAAMAHAGWDIATEGSAVHDEIAKAANECLDEPAGVPA